MNELESEFLSSIYSDIKELNKSVKEIKETLDKIADYVDPDRDIKRP
jgi:hypothetical protein